MAELRLPPNIRPSETLLLLRIPPNENTILKLFKHFKRYGRIQAIHSDGARTALITYATQDAAETAFKSAEAYAGNRLVQYRYPKDPDKVETKLSSVVTWPRVNQVLAQVSREIESAQKATMKLIDDMKQTHSQPPSEKLSLKEMLQEFKKHRDDIVADMTRLLKSRDEAAANQVPEIDGKLEVLGGQYTEVEESIRQLENEVLG
jgi:hypothetical protein